MTIEECIVWLEHHFDPMPNGNKQDEAVSMAIRSLKAWEKVIKFANSEKENNGTLRVHINDIKKFYKEIDDATCD